MTDFAPDVSTLLDAAGISGLVGITVLGIVRMIKKNGCTIKCYHCNGNACTDVDCEQGAPTQRYSVEPADERRCAAQDGSQNEAGDAVAADGAAKSSASYTSMLWRR